VGTKRLENEARVRPCLCHTAQDLLKRLAAAEAHAHGAVAAEVDEAR